MTSMAQADQGEAVERISLALRLVALINRAFCRIWYRMKRVGPCTVPLTGPAIVTANHTCSADPLMISAACRHRKVSFLIAEEYSDILVARWFVRLIDCIPVQRDAHDVAATRKALRRLREGAALGIFIEGRIPDPGEQVQPKDGVAILALRTGAPVVPVHLSGNRRRESIVGGFLARHRTRVRFGPPVDLSEFTDGPMQARVAGATKKIFRTIQELGVSAVTPT
jgi:1-acyl-sn-glycerol-3-phosphate acyltransferase